MVIPARAHPIEIRVRLEPSRFTRWPPCPHPGTKSIEGEFLARADGEETLSSVIARTVGPQLQEHAATTGIAADAVMCSVSLIVPRSGAAVEVSEVPVLSLSGHLRIGSALSLSIRELLRAHDAGLIAGDPREVVVRPEPPAATAGGAGWDAFVDALHVLWTVVQGVGASYAAFQAFERLLSRFRAGSRVLEEHADELDEAGIRPPDLPHLVGLRPWSTRELADAFAISAEEVVVLLPGLGFEHQPDGTWRRGDPLALAVVAQLLQIASSYEATVRDYDRLAEMYREYLSSLVDEKRHCDEDDQQRG